MLKLSRFLNSFRVKVALVLIVSLLFAATLGNYFIYKFAVDSQFNQLREKLKVIAQTAALAIDVDQLSGVALNRESIYSPAYRAIAGELTAIKQVNTGIRFIYTMAKTDKEGILQFIVDPDAINPKSKTAGINSYPGDKYDTGQFPEMLKAFNEATADKQIGVDQWGRVLSAYAPIRDKDGNTVAILGVDITADDVYLAERSIVQRGLLVLLLGIIFSLFLGIIVSRRISEPVSKLVEGTRHIASGDLGYRVNIKGKDEIAELAAAFNTMASSILEDKLRMHDYFYRAMQSLVRLLEAKNLYTKGHSDRVAELTEKIALSMGLTPEKVELLKRAAQLHDIGKLGIDERILNKTSSLDVLELELIHRHPQTGEDILQPVAFDKELLELVRSHHEHYDGKGYPDKLKGEDSGLIYQVIPVADSYDAMTSDRSYRKAMSKQEAIAVLKKNSGSQFNPKVVEAAMRIL